MQSWVTDVGKPAIGEHCRHLFAKAALGGARFDVMQLLADWVGGVSLDRRGVDPLVFPPLIKYFSVSN